MSRVQVDAGNLWTIAQKQISRLRPQTPVLVKSQPDNSKSIQSIFKKTNTKQIQNILPRGMYHVVQNKQQVPQSIKFLDLYAQKMGFMKMGQIYQTKGNKYLGRIQQISSNGQRFYKPFPKFQNKSSMQTPNLTQNLSFKATNTIQKWNQFIKAQAQLAQFLQDVSTPQNRKNLILTLSKSSSIGTDWLRVLSSIYFLYFDQKSSNKNYFNIQNIQYLRKLMQSKGQGLQGVYTSVSNYINGNATKNKQVLSKFHSYKVQSIKQSLSKEQYDIIKPYLQNKKAFVPKQMVQQTFLNNSQWFQVFTKSEQKNSSIIVTVWPYGQPWFKCQNYFD